MRRRARSGRTRLRRETWRSTSARSASTTRRRRASRRASGRARAGYDPDLVLTAIVRPFTRGKVERTAARSTGSRRRARARPCTQTGDRTMVSRDRTARPSSSRCSSRSRIRCATAPRSESRSSSRRRPRRHARRRSDRVRAGREDVEDDCCGRRLIAFPLLILLSFWVFRGLVAALLPPLVGGAHDPALVPRAADRDRGHARCRCSRSTS